MTGPIRQDIDYTKCNAYSAIAHMYAAISTKDGTADKTGGIIVFPQEVTGVRLSEDTQYKWTLGNFFKGRYTDKNGKVYSEDSLCLEITGVTEDSLKEIAEELCRTLNQESALIKSYCERNRILLVDNATH